METGRRSLPYMVVHSSTSVLMVVLGGTWYWIKTKCCGFAHPSGPNRIPQHAPLSSSSPRLWTGPEEVLCAPVSPAHPQVGLLIGRVGSDLAGEHRLYFVFEQLLGNLFLSLCANWLLSPSDLTFSWFSVNLEALNPKKCLTFTPV